MVSFSCNIYFLNSTYFIHIHILFSINLILTSFCVSFAAGYIYIYIYIFFVILCIHRIFPCPEYEKLSTGMISFVTKYTNT